MEVFLFVFLFFYFLLGFVVVVVVIVVVVVVVVVIVFKNIMYDSNNQMALACVNLRVLLPFIVDVK